MWQPSRSQWLVIWITVLLVILAWPPQEGGSLAVKAARWLADPRGTLPQMPDPLPLGLGDDGDAVAEHDRKQQEYFQFFDNSAMNRLRLRLKFAEDPFERATERQLLTGVGVFAALLLWRLNERR